MQLPRVELVRGVSLLAHRSLRRTQPSQSHERSFAGSRILAQLTSKEKKGLRSLANTLQQQKKLNIMQVGKNGITDGVRMALDQALTARELVKVKVGENSDDSEEDVAEVLAEEVKAEVVGMVGHTVLLARLKPKSESSIWPSLEAIMRNDSPRPPPKTTGRG